MKLTKNSKTLLSFFIKKGCIPPVKINKTTVNILLKLYQDIETAEKYINTLKKQKGDKFYNIKIEQIQSIQQIPKPKTFPSDGFPTIIRKHIDENTMSKITYRLKLLDRTIVIHFLLEDVNIEGKIGLYNNYIDNIMKWLVVVDKYSSKNCAKELTIYFYFTSQEKNIPGSNIFILDERHVNTAFTSTCPTISEIVIFRKEEWFKVFIHETFHNFGLDFSGLNNDSCNKIILNIFPVKSEVNLYEAYSETWAKIINAILCSYNSLTNKSDIDEFLNNFLFFINLERSFCCFQMVKVLDFMNLTYECLYKKDDEFNVLRNTFYKENTNVLAYYVITYILLNNVGDFLNWCFKNNTQLLQFEKIIGKQEEFCKLLIEKKYKSNTFLKNIKCVEDILYKLKNNTESKYTKDKKYLLNNLRMSICEMR